MIKKLLIGAVVLAALWSFPPARQRIAPVVEPVLERLGPVGDWLLNPARRYNTRTEIVFLHRQLVEDKDYRRPLPTSRNFEAWLQQNAGRNEGGTTDAWGHPYYMVRDRISITIGSVGEDGVQGTADDITRTLPF